MLNYYSIRGHQIDLAGLEGRLYEQLEKPGLCSAMRDAKPFPHLVFDGLWDTDFLRRIAEEFDDDAVQPLATHHESTFRSRETPRLRPASALYFWIVNSGQFAEQLARLCGLPGLLTDASLFGGGLHETRAGGWFDVHVDFEFHPNYPLKTQLAMITYLNEDWDPAWGGQLGLYDHETSTCVREIEPTLGRTILMRRMPHSFHGHPHPFRPPERKVRRSVASYYYTCATADDLENAYRHSGAPFLQPDWKDKVAKSLRMWTPPAALPYLRRIKRAIKYRRV